MSSFTFKLCHPLLSIPGFWGLHRDGYQEHSVDLCLQVGWSGPWVGDQPNNNHQCDLLRLWQGYFPQVHTKSSETFHPQPHLNTRLFLCLIHFCRVYQDAEVNITRNLASEKPVSLPPKRILPTTMTSILNLDPDNVVFYVGGYPENFTVTNHCCYLILPVYFLQA